jgi:tRNA(Ile)-lysidine synthase TilS/MesJ
MPRPSASIAAIEKDPSARRIVARWRELTGGSRVRDDRRRTLVACSGGADSSALLIALSSLAAPGSIAAAHILHDMRSPDEARLDRDAAASLAERFGVRLIERKRSAETTSLRPADCATSVWPNSPAPLPARSSRRHTTPTISWRRS